MNDTVKLLRECNAGTKMAVASFDEVLDKVKDVTMKKLMTESREHHEKLGDEIHSQLLQLGEDEKEPNPIAKGMSYIKTNMKMASDESDATIADLITDGCDMGIKSLHRYRNQYGAAESIANELCGRLIDIEEKLRTDLQK